MHYYGSERVAEQALVTARRFLNRWRDPVTEQAREDLVQEAAWKAWRGIDRVRDRSRFPAVVRTIARRVRWRVVVKQLRRARRLPAAGIGWSGTAAAPVPGSASGCLLRVSGQEVPRSWLRDRLDLVLARVGPLNRCLLYSFYEGFSCQELADRHRLTEQCVKVRLHRGRRRVREELERLVRGAGRELQP